jgi:pimeloyl-ACP methyl ester carboxylesterase
MWALKILLIPILVYVAIVAAIYFAQTSMIFPAKAVGGAGPLPPGAIRLDLATGDGHRLHGVHIVPPAPGMRPVILGFSGNAWNAEDAAMFLADLYPDADVVAFHYRGYRPSTGTASAAALLQDAPLIHDYVNRRFAGRPIVAVGFSIGSGVAAHLASRRPLTGLVLVTPFDSLTEVGRGHYPWLPVGPLLRHRIDPAGDMQSSRVPTAIIVAGRDTLIPPRRAQALAKKVPKLVYERTIEEAGHNDIYQHPQFRTAMAEALERVAAHPPA